MNRKSFFAVLILLFGIGTIACLLVPSAPPAVDVFTKVVVVGDAERNYRLVVPHRLSVPCPVLIAFHGIGDSADSMAGYSGLDQLASDHGCLLVYPSARRSMWATMNIRPDTLDENDDVRFFDSIMDQITPRYEIDATRVYLTGMSNGASFALLVAHARSGDVAAVVSCSGARPRSLRKPRHPFPIRMVAGSDDPIVDLMRADLEYYHGTGHQADLIVVRGMGHEWSRRHNSSTWEFLSSCKLSL